MKIHRLEDVPTHAMTMEGAKNVSKQVPISKDDGAPHFSFRVFTVAPEGHTPFHQHAWEHLNYIIAGEGTLVLDQGEEQPIRQGDFILVDPNEKHCYRNLSTDTPLVLICAVPAEHE